MIATEAAISSARTRNRASTSPPVSAWTVRGESVAGRRVVVAGVDGQRRWPGRRSPRVPMSAAWSAVSTAVPVNRSRTTLWPRARSTISATSAAMRRARRVGQRAQLGAAGPDPAAQQPVPGDLVVDPQQLLADPLGVGVEDAVADVVAQRADVGDVVVEPFQLEQDGPPSPASSGTAVPAGVLDGLAEGQRVADGGVAADPFGQLDPGRRGASLEELLDAAVDEPQPGLEVQDGLADDGEPEVAGLDHARRAPGRPGSRTPRGPRRCGTGTGRRRRRTAGGAPASARIGCQPAGPVEVPDQPARQRVVVGHDAEQVAHLAFEPAGAGRTARPGWAPRGVPGRGRRAARRAGPGRPAVNRYTTRSASAVVVAGDQGPVGKPVGESARRACDAELVRHRPSAVARRRR